MPEALWGWPPPVLDPAGPYADSVTLLAWVLLAMGVLVTAVVVAALWIALRGPERLKRKLGGEKAVWIGGIAFPAVVLTALLIWGLTLTASLTRDITGEEMRVRVTGEMWWFRVEYLDREGNVVLRDANQLHLPVGRPVVLELRSADVIHSFWVPNLSGKKDMVPGRTNLLRIQADKAGSYGGVCAEYCGGPHALMGFVAVAHDEADWRTWLDARTSSPPPVAEQRVPGVLPALGSGRSDSAPTAANTAAQYDPRRGWQLFLDSGCAACHRIAGSEANGLAGPDLTHVGSRLTLGAGILPNNRGTMIGWIGDSQSIKPGNRMPSYTMLSAEELGHIAAFLEAQK
ncbi:MAG: cytochrome c oxidase subunit II [Croceibacterium sp.]